MVNGTPTWQTVNAGGINYINANPNAEVDTTGWATYADAAQNIPVDGTGGTATGLTFSRTTSSPLVGTASFQMAQANSTSLQGKGVSYDFTIDSGYQAQVLQISFNYNASSTFVASNGVTAPLNDGTSSTNAGNSDVEIFLYDKTNAILIPVSPEVITANGANNFTFKGTFQTASNSTSYRLIFHVATASANATGWTFKFDNVSVGPQILVQGAVVTDWVPFTPTGSWVSNTTYTGRMRRVGDTQEVQVKIALSGAPTSTTLTINTPSTIDTSKLAGSDPSRIIGYGGTLSAASANYDLRVKINTTTSVTLSAVNTASTYGNWGNASTDVTQILPNTYANGDNIEVIFSYPVVGWSSTSVMSNDTDTRIVSAR